MDKQQVLIIDDDPDYCSLVEELLSGEYECISALSGQQGIDKFGNECQPLLVLVDLKLPDFSCFKVCQKLKEVGKERDFAIIVVSGDNELQTKLRAFEVGAEDFIAKPFELKELFSRVKRTVEFVHQRSRLKKEGDDNKNLANSAMALASQYSVVMNFFKSLNQCYSHQQIADQFFNSMNFFGFKSSIMIHVEDVEFYGPSLSDLSPIEKNIYDLLSERGRLYEFGSRLMVNGKNVSFLVKNMPLDETELGQARDFLAALIEGIETKLRDIQLKSGVIYAVGELNQTISKIKIGMHEHNAVVSTAMTDMLTKISSSYHFLGLTEEQELFFTDLVENGTKNMLGAEKLLFNVQEELESLKNKMEVMDIETVIEEQDNNAGDDVELF